MTKETPFKTHELLTAPQIAHGFFGRRGGVSKGQYQSLNTGAGSDDDPANVEENRARVAHSLGTASDQLISLYQVHSTKVVTVTEPVNDRSFQADGLVTDRPDIALSALAADCGPVLFADVNAGIIGACHAGWRGAVSGITDSTIKAMTALGSDLDNIHAVLGPCISQTSYEVGHDYRDAIVAEKDSFDRFFQLGPLKPDGTRRPHFDLKRFILAKLRAAGLTKIDALADCTYAQPEEYFSYRYNTHQGISDYGRNISAIMLRE